MTGIFLISFLPSSLPSLLLSLPPPPPPAICAISSWTRHVRSPETETESHPRRRVEQKKMTRIVGGLAHQAIPFHRNGPGSFSLGTLTYSFAKRRTNFVEMLTSKSHAHVQHREYFFPSYHAYHITKTARLALQTRHALLVSTPALLFVFLVWFSAPRSRARSVANPNFVVSPRLTQVVFVTENIGTRKEPTFSVH